MDQETSVLLPAPYSKPVSAMAHLLSATICYPRTRDGVHVREVEEEKNDCGETQIAMHALLKACLQSQRFHPSSDL